jgi:RimJ/RimL family protein N-acetyltransferase
VVGLARIISVARADNAASRRVMEKCGLRFQELTHKGALVAWYALDRADWQAGLGPAPARPPTGRHRRPTERP